ncbi:MAG: HAMP domain-containing sensor histidine kinase [Victivallaceae bacterium]|nr:HAMP domain-containing sensor histidine kinase [Victivallaceae bacterium]
MMEDLFAKEEIAEQAPWIVRKNEVLKIKEYLAEHYGDAGATKRLAKFLDDEKWEIRSEVALAMVSVGEDALPMFEPLLSDANLYVKSKARFAMERRENFAKIKVQQEKRESRLFTNIEKLRKNFGPEAAKLAREDIENAYELTVGYAAHDIRGILSPIADYLEVMNRLASNELTSSSLVRFNQAKQFIDVRLDMLFRMINDMQNLARKTPVERVHENLRDLLTNAVNEVKNIFSGKMRDISRVSFITDDIPIDLAVPVANLPITLAFVNLMKNAVESYMSKPDLAREGSVEISAREVCSGVEVVIRDHGMGLSESELKRIRLFLPRSTSKKKSGSGLGMAIAYAKIKDHGGTLSIESDGANKGVTATVFLPYKEN